MNLVMTHGMGHRLPQKTSVKHYFLLLLLAHKERSRMHIVDLAITLTHRNFTSVNGANQRFVADYLPALEKSLGGEMKTGFKPTDLMICWVISRDPSQ